MAELERLFRPLAAAAGLPVPLTKVMVDKFEVDFFWPGLGLVVETDGWRYHRTPSAQTRDALRFQLHTASGLTPLRFSHHQVKYEPRHVEEILRKTVSNLRAGARQAGKNEPGESLSELFPAMARTTSELSASARRLGLA